MSDKNLEAGAVARFGYISNYDAERHRARVIFPDKDNLPSGWLPVVVPNSLKNHDELHLDINEHVLCLMLGNGIEAGAVIGAIYDNKNKPPESDKNTRKVKFDDGTEILYDRKNHELKINCVGNITIHADGNMKISADKIETNFKEKI